MANESSFFDSFSFDLPDFDLPDLDFSLPDFELPSFDFELPSFDFSMSDLSLPDFSLPDFELPDLSSFIPDFELPSFDFSGYSDDVANDLDTSWLDEIESGMNTEGSDTSWLDQYDNLDVEGPNYLLDGVKLPGEGLNIPETALYATKDEVVPDLSGLGLEEPRLPSLSEMGGAQGLFTEIPAQFDESGELIPGSGGYVGELGFVPYDAVAAIGDPSSFINRPDLIDKTVISKDMISSADLGKGTTTTTTPGGTTVTKTPTDIDTTKETDPITKIIEKVTGGGGTTDKSTQMLLALLGGILGLMNRGGGQPQAGYQGSIPKYTATRGTPTAPTAGGRRPGGAGIGSLTGGVTYTKAAQGGLMELARGSEGRYLRGRTDGMADKIPASIEGEQPALLSHGEYVIPADVVSHLGNGNSDAGAKRLEEMSKKVRTARTGNPKQGKQINPRKYLPA